MLKPRIDRGFSDLICETIEGHDVYGSDDIVEFKAAIDGTSILLHAEGPSQTDPKKSKGLLGVEIDGGRMVGPLDDATWQRIDKFVRLAIKDARNAASRGSLFEFDKSYNRWPICHIDPT
jgi:hypothetical protein